MIRHVVTWKLVATDPHEKADAVDTIVRLLSSLPPLVPSVRSLTVAGNMAYFDANWDVVLIADFDDLAGLDAYQSHPEHLLVVPQIKALVSARASVDIDL
ncbi:Dabb family protein [Herbiconiux daphne]|uniref:Dabb family protein n=1 Tax=Herbiconiux daphne TaxID=2970914 RepID=A0ABT2GW31_9MICO|nr:Dabb family protein [Herbiconiux daphne]MCS5732169.1 Dabb family protein [Herbiconiux daphne]